MKTKKPKNVITIVHTGTGNTGNTQLGINKVPKTHDKIKYVGLLDTCQSYTYTNKDILELGYNNVITQIQNVFFLLGGLTHNPNKEDYKTSLYEYYDLLKNSLEDILNHENVKLKPLEGFIRTNVFNYPFMQLRTKIRETEIMAVHLIKTLTFDMDEIHIKMLNLLSDIVFSLAWLISVKNDSLSVWTGE